MRVGFIGVGGHATTNLYPNLGSAGLDLVATCARHLDRAQAAAARFGAPHAFDDAQKMLDSVELDAAIVCVAPDQYATLVTVCLEAGLPVFTDKPAAATAVEGRRLAEVSARTGKPVVVGYQKRFAPAYRKAKELVSSPDFGQPTLGAFTFAMGPWGGDLRNYLIDNPVHHLDLARYMLGELSDLQAYVTQGPRGGTALACVARGESGAVATLNLCTTAGWAHRNEWIEVFGEQHSVYVDNVDTCWYRPPDRPAQVWYPNYTVPRLANTSAATLGFLGELEHFRHVVVEGAEPISDIASAAATLALAERLCDIVGV